MTLKIAIVVHGRFHAFDLTRALLARGHDVTVFTNYPRWATRRFGLGAEHVRGFWWHGVLSRLMGRVRRDWVAASWEDIGHKMFGRWAASMIARESWDVVHCWSGVSDEILRSGAARGAMTLLMRGSAHISVQRRLLDEEALRVGSALDRPSDWMINRELREYALADVVVVLSRFALQSFEAQGVPEERLQLLSLGVDVGAFKASGRELADRVRRVARGDKLNVLYVGSLSYQKGLWDLLQVARSADPNRFQFRLVGEPLPEALPALRSAPANVTVVGKVPQDELPSEYRAADLFIYPTIQDGFAVVLAQAMAAGLPVITTPNCAGEDLVHEGENGWIVPIRDPDAIADRLNWCHANRQALSDVIAFGSRSSGLRDWSLVAADFERFCERTRQPVTEKTPAPRHALHGI